MAGAGLAGRQAVVVVGEVEDLNSGRKKQSTAGLGAKGLTYNFKEERRQLGG